MDLQHARWEAELELRREEAAHQREEKVVKLQLHERAGTPHAAAPPPPARLVLISPLLHPHTQIHDPLSQGNGTFSYEFRSGSRTELITLTSSYVPSLHPRAQSIAGYGSSFAWLPLKNALSRTRILKNGWKNCPFVFLKWLDTVFVRILDVVVAKAMGRAPIAPRK